MVIAPNRKRKGSGGRHAHLVEYPHRIGRKGDRMTAGHPFFWPTIQAAEPEVISRLTADITSEVTAFWAAQGGSVG